MEPKPKTGTKEWAPYSANIFTGCAHNCRYCYARKKALDYGRISGAGEWPKMKLNERAFAKKAKKMDGRIMFPTTHDLLPEHKGLIRDYLERWLEAGNEFLIVTKPHMEVVDYLCRQLSLYRDQITLRFTIGSLSDATLGFWEPGAPMLYERVASLTIAHLKGYRTSVSCEPYLDETINRLVEMVLPLATDSVWVGKMNGIASRVDTTGWTLSDRKFLDHLEVFQADAAVKTIYKVFKYNPKVRWKDSIKRILGLPEEEVG
jgi:DNA repair photolyase